MDTSPLHSGAEKVLGVCAAGSTSAVVTVEDDGVILYDGQNKVRSHSFLLLILYLFYFIYIFSLFLCLPFRLFAAPHPRVGSWRPPPGGTASSL